MLGKNKRGMNLCAMLVALAMFGFGGTLYAQGATEIATPPPVSNPDAGADDADADNDASEPSPPVSDDVFIPSEEVEAAEELAFPVNI